MKQLIRRLSRVGDSSQQEERLLRGMSPGKGRRRESAEVPEGHLPVYVGEEMERFVVRADLLSRPVFVELLRRSAEEYGYEQRGVLRIPCSAAVFQRVLDLLLAGAQPSSDGLNGDLDRSFWGAAAFPRS
ncbi:unnamed protein product [Spirodela intermedia]|uniref:Uncharacterized protein n=1 Tax=Spirodela intermedia TaxID=51605 RepID=A0A7I8K8X5_SPIIN|nr:unnamed protein product [Spirodela intermedia]